MRCVAPQSLCLFPRSHGQHVWAVCDCNLPLELDECYFLDIILKNRVSLLGFMNQCASHARLCPSLHLSRDARISIAPIESLQSTSHF